LPVPVSAHAITSCPARTSGSTAVWIGVVFVKPRSRMPSSTASSNPRPSKSSGSASGSIGTKPCSIAAPAGRGGVATIGAAPDGRRRRGRLPEGLLRVVTRDRLVPVIVTRTGFQRDGASSSGP